MAAVSGEATQLSVTVPFVGETANFASAGGVPSYLSDAVCEAPLPAASVQPPVRVAAPLSGPEYVGAVQPAMPDMPSPPLTFSLIAWLYQPFESGGRSRAAVTLGAVASYLRPKPA